MTAFSDNFPFDPPAETAAPEPEPVVHAAPGHFDESFPFESTQSMHETELPAMTQAVESTVEQEEAAAPIASESEQTQSSIFGDGFPFDAPRVFDDPPATAPVAAPFAIESAPAAAPVEFVNATPASAPISIFTDENTLTATVIPAAAPDPLNFPERRKSPRQTMLAKAMLRPDAGGPARAVELRNLSLLGVRFRSSESIRVGERFHIKLEVGPLKWATRLRVINCVKDESGAAHYVGCAFIGNELTRAYATAA